MALPQSGPIRMSDIKAELASSSNSLRNYSAAAGKTAPDAMSEFYGYAECITYTLYNPDNNYDVLFDYIPCDSSERVYDSVGAGRTTVFDARKGSVGGGGGGILTP
jgi:hypothetical protein